MNLLFNELDQQNYLKSHIQNNIPIYNINTNPIFIA